MAALPPKGGAPSRCTPGSPALDDLNHFANVPGRHMLPFQLDSGIYLEHVQVLLPWGAKISDLPNFGSPVVTQKPTGVWMEWLGSRCLGGVLCKVEACQLFGPAVPGAYQIYLPEFHWAQFLLGPTADMPLYLMRRTFRHLEQHLGSPHYFYEQYSRGLPSIWWEFERIKVRIGPVYGQDLASMTISHEPDGFEDLKRQAAEFKAKNGVGARQDYRKGAVIF